MVLLTTTISTYTTTTTTKLLILEFNVVMFCHSMENQEEKYVMFLLYVGNSGKVDV